MRSGLHLSRGNSKHQPVIELGGRPPGAALGSEAADRTDPNRCFCSLRRGSWLTSPDRHLPSGLVAVWAAPTRPEFTWLRYCAWQGCGGVGRVRGCRRGRGYRADPQEPLPRRKVKQKQTRGFLRACLRSAWVQGASAGDPVWPWSPSLEGFSSAVGPAGVGSRFYSGKCVCVGGSR